MFYNGGEMEDVGNYCVDPATSNPVSQSSGGLMVDVEGAAVEGGLVRTGIVISALN